MEGSSDGGDHLQMQKEVRLLHVQPEPYAAVGAAPHPYYHSHRKHPVQHHHWNLLLEHSICRFDHSLLLWGE